MAGKNKSKSTANGNGRKDETAAFVVNRATPKQGDIASQGYTFDVKRITSKLPDNIFPDGATGPQMLATMESRVSDNDWYGVLDTIMEHFGAGVTTDAAKNPLVWGIAPVDAAGKPRKAFAGLTSAILRAAYMGRIPAGGFMVQNVTQKMAERPGFPWVAGTCLLFKTA